MGKTKKVAVAEFKTKELKARGWSASMITKLLGKPDRVRTLSRGVAHYFNQDRVKAAEAGPAFTKLHASAVARSEAAIKVAEARAAARQKEGAEVEAELLAQAHEVEIRIWPIELGPIQCPQSAVNRLRHEATNYDSILYSLGVSREAYSLIKERVLDLIAEKYPVLREECDRQRAVHKERMEAGERAFSFLVEEMDDILRARRVGRLAA